MDEISDIKIKDHNIPTVTIRVSLDQVFEQTPSGACTSSDDDNDTEPTYDDYHVPRDIAEEHPSQSSNVANEMMELTNIKTRNCLT